MPSTPSQIFITLAILISAPVMGHVLAYLGLQLVVPMRRSWKDVARRFGPALLGLMLAGLGLVLYGFNSAALAFTGFHLLLVACAAADVMQKQLPRSLVIAGITFGIALTAPGMPLQHSGPIWVSILTALLAWALMRGVGAAQSRFSRNAISSSTASDALTVALVATWLGWRALPVVLVGACVICILVAIRAVCGAGLASLFL